VTSGRPALVTAVALYAVAAALAVLLVPWDSDVMPWADPALPALADFTADQVAAITAYVEAVWLPGILGLIAGPIAAAILLLVPALRRRIIGLGPRGHPVLGDLIAAAAVLAIVRLAALPFAVWSAQVRRDAGLLIEPWGTWWLRWAGESATYVLLGSLAVAAGLAVLRRWPRRGWIAVTAAAGLVALVVTAAIPLLQRIEGTAADPALTARVLDLADRAGVDVAHVSVIAVSDTTPAINANVSGWGPTRTVTLYDTVATTMSDAQIDALIAHELIHVREGDALLGAVLAALGAAGTAALVAALILSTRVRRWLPLTSRVQAAAVPLAVATVLAAALAATVAGANVSRPLEARADREAIAVTGDPQAYRSLITQLAVTNRSTLTPPSWRYALLFTHPTPLQRLAAAQE